MRSAPRVLREWLLRHWMALVLSIALALALFGLLRVVGLPVVPRRELLLRIAPQAVALHVLCYLSALYVRSHRWAWLLAPIPEAAHVPLRRILAASFVGYGAMILLPFRTGEIVRPALLREKGKLSGWTLAATVAAERIMDGVVLMAVLLVSMLLAGPLEAVGQSRLPVEAIWKSAYVAFGLFAAAFVVLVLFSWRRAFAVRLVENTIGRLSEGLGKKLASLIGRLAEGLAFLVHAHHTARFIAATVLYFALYAGSVYALVAGSGMRPPDVVQICVIAGLMHLGAMLPNAPGYFGAYQFSVYAGLAMFYSEADVTGVGSAVVFALYVLHMGVPLIIAVVALALMRLTPGRAMAAAVAAERDQS